MNYRTYTTHTRGGKTLKVKVAIKGRKAPKPFPPTPQQYEENGWGIVGVHAYKAGFLIKSSCEFEGKYPHCESDSLWKVEVTMVNRTVVEMLLCDSCMNRFMDEAVVVTPRSNTGSKTKRLNQ